MIFLNILISFLSIFQMFEWISHNRDLFLVNYTEIGDSQKLAVELSTEHQGFAAHAMVSSQISLCLNRCKLTPIQ